MTTFFRFPRTPHLFWLGAGVPRDDKVLTPVEAAAFLAHDLVLEEKVDGANTGLSFSADGTIQVQNRGAYLTEPYNGQYAKFGAWLAPRLDSLFDTLADRFILFGEWCYARHSLDYSALPDWFLAFDVYDRERAVFLDSAVRNDLTLAADCVPIARLERGRFGKEALMTRLQQRRSLYREGFFEGLVLRLEADGQTVQRAKLVRRDFVQAIGAHWSRRGMVANRLCSRQAPA
ncbi:MAG: hypothetical protein A2087_13895 [Spirochaetes bacterium GWD1_61_31]|nr:MAG: hypothetical protein A2Y37_04890 [Spirochaetes bacterium GWB1_60_80]OHD29120.1 MAG: hypothetical protein A2004_10630 [Spirochaetes bacterium GWC1_61_12]OHD41876.1 MAG: hypothetical protein A2087_13895 [Spirochaetes bacterium GWD1_61_31]OHD43714.1 MAG: hypothetical protein A2Y35_00085 [Spirochaetes bacterium GWE1_60_18]OHD60196.1 MAG: hypothetical protein A2Y32_07130 [Spirochaetes bacterium GWF1_60_12]HAP42544.1 DNA ligase [Spirochaetaceae bacterium]